MGLGGPIRKPHSIRGEREQKEANQGWEPAVNEAPVKPDWLPPAAAEIWSQVLTDLLAANVPLQRVDAHAMGMYALAILESKKAAEAGDSKLAARLGRDALQWAGQLGATPASRARLSIKPPRKANAEDEVWDSLFDRK